MCGIESDQPCCQPTRKPRPLMDAVVLLSGLSVEEVEALGGVEEGDDE